MDEQGRIVIPMVGATGNRASSDQLPSTSYREFYGYKGESMSQKSKYKQK